jgi:hypothetical protein
MDIDAVHVDALTTEEKETLMKEGRCFRCKKMGHISKKCPLKEKENRNAPRRDSYQTTVRTAVSKETRIEELAGGIRGLGDEGKNELLDVLMEKGF